jgi:signal transduction histidine kinase
VDAPGAHEAEPLARDVREAREQVRQIAEEQAGLRRVAVLAARGERPEAVFAAVAEEAGRVVPATDFALVGRYDRDGVVEIVGAWSRTGTRRLLGLRAPLGGRNVSTLVFERHGPAQVDHLADDGSAGPAAPCESGARSSAGAPISVEGQLWGVMIVASVREDALPAGAGERLAGFTDLLAIAIANVQARVELRGFAAEQAALRRVATLVARAAPPQEVFATVTEEAGRVLSADLARMNRYEPDGGHTVVAGWTSTGDTMPVPLDSRWGPGGRNVAALVFQTGRPARIDDYTAATGSGADLVRRWGLRSAVGAPVSVEGRLWGVLAVGSRTAPLPADTEVHLAEFTELVATAIANTEARAALTASRARIVAAADAARRRIERDLHDSAQQGLVSLTLQLRAAQAAAPAGADELVQRLESAIAGADDVLEELREIARVLHPSVLAEGGLRPALRALARRCAIPVRLDVQVTGRLPEPTELAAYYTVAEALTNTAKHARASAAEVEVVTGEGVLLVRIRDDGTGGAEFGRGTGLAGLRDRVESLGGHIFLDSPRGAGTSLRAELPLTVANDGVIPP